MSMSKPRTNNNTINRQACQWVAKLHETELSEKEHSEFKAWMAENPEHRLEMRRMAKRWDELNSLTLLAVPGDTLEQQLKHKKNAKPSFAKSRLKFGAFAAAACFAFAVLIWPAILSDKGSTPSLLSYSTAIGEQQRITLPDNSTVLLNTQSQFDVAYSPNYRDIYLVHGEAHFEVESLPGRPFRVFAGKSKVRAVGTAFSVYLKKETVEVTVTHGKVEIDSIRDSASNSKTDTDAINNRAIVNAGQLAEFDQVVGTIKTNHLPKAAHIPAWHNGQLKFSGEPLEKVVEEISRYSPFSIVILDSELRNLRIGGLFNVGETRKMFDALEDGFGIKAKYINENLIHLTLASSNTKRP